MFLKIEKFAAILNGLDSSKCSEILNSNAIPDKSSQPNKIRLLSNVKFCALDIFDYLLKDTTPWFRNYKLLNISVRFVFYINT